MAVSIVIEDLVVRHGELTAVDHLSLEVAEGGVMALLGPNGAGKTSTVETLEGLRAPSAGRVRVLGLDPISERSRLVADIGVMLQQGGVYPVMTPDQALRLFAAYYADPLDPADLLERLGLAEVAATPWRRLSGGEQQRLSLALALVGRPRVLFLDEPTAGVDVHGRATIREVIAEQASQGVTILLTTHEMAEAEAVADRVAIIHRGRLAVSGTMDELTSGGVRFGAPAGLDVGNLSAALGATVIETVPGSYAIDADTSGSLVGDLAGWLASRGLSLSDLRSGASLEDAYRAVVGELALAEASVDRGLSGRPATSGRRRRR
ncbi:MAG: ABC transporter ATP-binding protein [Actinomycetes bacterium]